jgi:hypothetical protein
MARGARNRDRKPQRSAKGNKVPPTNAGTSRQRRGKPPSTVTRAASSTDPRSVVGSGHSAPASLAEFLRTIDELSPAERKEIIGRGITLIGQVYVHLQLKRAMHAVDPLQRLRLLQQRIGSVTDREFHREMASIFNSLHDLHTRYIFPVPYQGRSAYLPFLVEEYFEAGEASRPKLTVSKLIDGFQHDQFKPGVILTHWNGIPIERAVEMNAEMQAGSNPDARWARGLEALTIRPLFLGPPPDEDWVVIDYQEAGGEHAQKIKLEWRLYVSATAPGQRQPTQAAPLALQVEGIDLQTEAVRQVKASLFSTGGREKEGTAAGPSAAVATAWGDPHASLAMGVDLQTEIVRQVKKALFAPNLVEEEGRMAGRERSRAPTAKAAENVPPGKSTMPGQFSFRAVDTPSGRFGYVRIFSFAPPFLETADSFVQEFLRIIRLLPQTGLIIDVRANPGGNILAGERLLQLLTPRSIAGERFQFINTPLVLEICSGKDAGLSQWRDSIVDSIATGETYSQGFPIAPEDSYNLIGQQYVGPVVLIIDALCYSTTDIFAAGFQDHGIGAILGTNRHTGAGGANVWQYGYLGGLLPATFPPLPRDVSFSIAARRSTRVGNRAGVPVEDLGVVPDDLHLMTLKDLLSDNIDLINHAGKILASQRFRAISYRTERGYPVKLSITAKNIDRIDAYHQGRPLQSVDLVEGTGVIELPKELKQPTDIELRGFDAGAFVARAVISL